MNKEERRKKERGEQKMRRKKGGVATLRCTLAFRNTGSSWMLVLTSATKMRDRWSGSVN